MNSNKYYIGIILRVIVIVLSSLLLAFLSFKTNYLYSISSLLILVFIQTWNLIGYIIKRRDELKRMLEYIKENNPTLYFSQSREYPFNELGYFLNEIGDIVREVRAEKENQLHYTEYIIQHVSIGLIAFDQYGKVEIINQAAKNILNIQALNTIDVLDKIKPGLMGILKKMSPLDQKTIVLKSNEKLQQLSIRVSLFKIGHKEIKLVSFQDIKNELDEKEMDSWQKLIRVLTHEIINSITPVTSLTGTLSGFFKKENNMIIDSKNITNNIILKAVTGLDLIEERGNAILEFVNKFRSLTKLPTPKFEEIKLSNLLSGIEILKKDELTKKGISFEILIEKEDRTIICDKNLIENVLINLINNAAEAVSQNEQSKIKNIKLSSSLKENQHTEITLRDNGCGIAEDLLEQIFIPFFTTKEYGSGIGLSLAQQIMRLHGGTISVQSEPNVETILTLRF